MKEVAEVVFLAIKPYSESSLWVSFFSEKHGLQNAIIKGGKRKKIRPMVLGLYQVILYRWSSSGLQNINSVERSYQLENTYNSPVKILIAFFVAESIKSFLSNEVVDRSFFSFIKKSIHELNETAFVKTYPVCFLADLISFSGHAPLNSSGLKIHNFNIKTGEFNSQEASSSLVDDPTLALAIHEVFYNNSVLNEGLEPRLFDVLLEYCNYHLPGYNSKKSIEVIRETLYD